MLGNLFLIADFFFSRCRTVRLPPNMLVWKVQNDLDNVYCRQNGILVSKSCDLLRREVLLLDQIYHFCLPDNKTGEKIP